MSFSRRNFLIATSVSPRQLDGAVRLQQRRGSRRQWRRQQGPDGPGVKTTARSRSAPRRTPPGPAPEVSGAVKGGTIYGSPQDDFSHLDPAAHLLLDRERHTVPGSCALPHRLQDRRQTGHATLVGDLATDAGTHNDDGKTWTFTLKDGIKWEDGKDLTVDDVRHGFERALRRSSPRAPRYVQQALTGKGDWRKYKGPYEGKHLDSIVTDKARRRSPSSWPKPARTSTSRWPCVLRAGAPRSRTPRRTTTRRRSPAARTRSSAAPSASTMTLVRNEHWDPETDPIRNAYPDEFRVRVRRHRAGLHDRPLHRGQGQRPARGLDLQRVAPAERIAEGPDQPRS